MWVHRLYCKQQGLPGETSFTTQVWQMAGLQPEFR